MGQKCIERFKKLVADFRALTTKVQKYKTLRRDYSSVRSL